MSPDDTEVPRVDTTPKHYSPSDVLEILKLLAEGDITDEQVDAYEEDANRMRAYAVVAKQRSLTEVEQQLVDEAGARLAEEALPL